jgi:hypothetical protein
MGIPGIRTKRKVNSSRSESPHLKRSVSALTLQPFGVKHLRQFHGEGRRASYTLVNMVTTVLKLLLTVCHVFTQVDPQRSLLLVSASDSENHLPFYCQTESTSLGISHATTQCLLTSCQRFQNFLLSSFPASNVTQTQIRFSVVTDNGYLIFKNDPLYNTRSV